ncbi:aldehyde dehydrogenase family protein, partial [Streptomyces viridosporus]|uniref:aldehyde dehydrogenase family protein n=1 Tax=Streptomyces viridosporus TaxID=67581 RepID=UPI0013576FAA
MLHRRVPRVSVVAAGLTALAVLGLTGCDSDTDDTGSAATSGPSVIAPGGPGEANRTLSAEEAAQQRAEDDSPNSADVSYVRMMIEHHAQALEMTDLVPDRAESPKIVKLAERIAAAQRPEIGAMKGWLKTHGKAAGGGGHDHDHATMPGMATQAQLKNLRAADGKAFKTVSPATEEVLSEVARAGEADVDRAVRAARKAFGKWSALPGSERAKYLFRIARIIQERIR